MKKVYLLLTAICLTALTGCIKEEPYTLEEATIEVNLDTRSGTQSEQQGDRIEDVMIWVFKSDKTLAGWRTYTPPTDVYTYTSLTLHIPVALCNGDSEIYTLVAVLNQSTWGNIVDADGNILTLNSETTYDQLIGARFANPTLIASAITEGQPGVPTTMPASHWCEVEVTKKNTHANNNCAVANLDVFRSIAKTQLFVTKASNDFDLVINSATLKSSKAPTEGMVLSASSAANLKATNAAPAWFGTNAPATFNTSFSQSLKKADGTSASATVAANAENYTDVFVGSAFLYENADGFTVDYTSYDYTTAPTGSNGYYLTINYTVDGDSKVGYVPLPAAVRNHDIQVRALVEASKTSQITFNVKYEVVEWDTVNNDNINFQ